ncbi:MAG: hypothetical protein MI748_11135 [Opitutales bacterium]|nr:hypothetical protein [Opitutales bacterium]
MLSRLSIARVKIAALSILTYGIFACWCFSDREREFSIESGDAASRLLEFAKAAGISIVFQADQLEGIRTNTISGSKTPSEALKLMLEGTPLGFDEDAETGAIAVVKKHKNDFLSENSGGNPGSSNDNNPNQQNTKDMNPKKPMLNKLLSGLTGIAVAAVTPITAQDAVDIDEDIYELSPFVIQTEEGWSATESLAGSRLKTDLKDVPAAIEVMTLDFMDDFGVNDMEEAIIYSLNVVGPEDRVTGNGFGFGVDQIRNFSSIRGIAGAQLSRNFFAIQMPTDNYNVSRLTIAAGPQAVLFGTGSPAGVMDVTYNRAELSKDFGTFRAQFDNFGGDRYTIDYNKVIIDGKLAIRAAGLKERRKQEWDPNHDDRERYYLTALFRPFEKTTLSVHFEDVHMDRNRASRMFPIDNISPWFKSGAQGFANTWNSTGAPHLGDIFVRNPDRVTMVYGNDDAGLLPQSYNDSVSVRGPNELPGIANQDNDRDGWTLTNHQDWLAVDGNIRGTSRFQEADSKQFLITLEQQITDKLFIELAYNKEEYRDHNWSSANSNTVDVDPNLYLNDGVTPNPNFGKLYVDGTPSFSNGEDDLESWRASVSYEFDFAEKFQNNKIFKWFGLHRMGALISQDKSTHWDQQGMRYRFVPGPGETDPVFDFTNNFSSIGSRRWASHNTRQLLLRYYLEDGSDHSRMLDDYVFDGRPVTIPTADGSYTINPLDNGYTNADGARLIAGNGATGSYTINDSWMLTWQGFFLDGRIATTYGYRDIEAKSKIPNGSVRDNTTGLWPYYRDLAFNEEWGETQSGIVRTRGIAVHPLRGLDLGIISDLTFTYNKSDTFQPNIGKFDPYGTEYPGAEGEGEDIGVRVDLFDGKFTVEYTDFKLKAEPYRVANTPFHAWRDPLWNMENRIRSLWPDVPTINVGEGGFRDNGRANYWIMSQRDSEGYEISISANPIKGLNLRFTYTDRESIESNIGQVWFDWLDERLPVWQSINVPEGGVENPRDLDDDGVVGTWTWDTAFFADNDPNISLADQYQDVVVNGRNGSAIIRALDGKGNEFDRSKMWNFNANYSFREGHLKGFKVGGALRWRAAALLDYGFTVLNGEEIVDLNNPYYGEDELKLDLALTYNGTTDLIWGERDYRVQLNVRNAMDTNGAVPVMTDVNGAPTRLARTEGRRIIFSFEIDL